MEAAGRADLMHAGLQALAHPVDAKGLHLNIFFGGWD